MAVGIVELRARRELNGCIVVRDVLPRKRVCGMSERKNIRRRESAASGSMAAAARVDKEGTSLVLC